MARRDGIGDKLRVGVVQGGHVLEPALADLVAVVLRIHRRTVHVVGEDIAVRPAVALSKTFRTLNARGKGKGKGGGGRM